MATLTVEIDKEKDLPAIEALLSKMGLKFEVEEDDDWGNLPEAAVEGIKAGLEDSKAGRVQTHDEVMAHIDERFNRLKNPERKETIIDFIERLDPPNIDPKADVKELYYQTHKSRP